MGLMVFIFAVGALILTYGPAMTQTQGEAAVNNAAASGAIPPPTSVNDPSALFAAAATAAGVPSSVAVTAIATAGGGSGAGLGWSFIWGRCGGRSCCWRGSGLVTC